MTHTSCPVAEHDGCCACLSDEGGGDPNGDWDNGVCCGHCTAVCSNTTIGREGASCGSFDETTGTMGAACAAGLTCITDPNMVCMGGSCPGVCRSPTGNDFCPGSPMQLCRSLCPSPEDIRTQNGCAADACLTRSGSCCDLSCCPVFPALAVVRCPAGTAARLARAEVAGRAVVRGLPRAAGQRRAL